MPNWCSNTLLLQHDDPAMITRAREAFADGRLLDEFIPIPQDIKESGWYDFCVNEWGTKWDVGRGDGINDWDDHMLSVYFDSAWSPPVAAYAKLEELGFRVEAMYYEPGMAFCGKYDEFGDDCYEFSGMNASDVIDSVPHEIDETFGISENMQMMEEEEPLTEWYVQGVKDKGLE